MEHTARNVSESDLPLFEDFPHRAHPRTHSRSASWSHNAWSHTNTSSNSMATIFSPMRMLEGLVPGLTSRTADNHSTSITSSATNVSAAMGSAMGSAIGAVNGANASLRARNEAGSTSTQHSRQSSTVTIDIPDAEQGENGENQDSNGNQRQDTMEFFGTINWIERTLPFILLLLSRIMWDHRLGILVFIGLFGTFFHVNSSIRKQVALKERRLNRIIVGTFIFILTNIVFIYFVFARHNLEQCLIFHRANFVRADLWTVCWCVGITDFVVRFGAMALKCVVVVLPRRLVHFRKRGKYFLLIEQVSQMYRILLPIPQWYFYFTDYNTGGEYFAVVSTTLYILLKVRMVFNKRTELTGAIKCFWRDTRYGRLPTKEQLIECGDSCPICQEKMEDPIELNMCKHIFCEDCIVMWFDRERTCPMCRAKVAEDPAWRDGNTQAWIQMF